METRRSIEKMAPGLLLLTLVGIAVAQTTPRNDHKCETYPSPQPACDQSGNLYCAAMAANTPPMPCDATTECFKGSSSNTIPANACVPQEGATCNEHSSGGTNCGRKRQGWCKTDAMTGVCKCLLDAEVDPPEDILINACQP